MSKILDIITNPNEILRQKSELVKKQEIQNKAFLALLDDMTETMLKKDGVGLAAPQIAINKRIVVIHHEDKTLVLINPEITKKSWAKEIGEEGCLSVPNVFGPVSRHKKINCNYLDISGNKQNIKASGMLARILQHEIDHLDGVLFIDKLEEKN